MEINHEYVNPFDEKYDYLMRIEHLARYYFASDILQKCHKVLDVACADGYGTKILSQSIVNVLGVDRNEKYLNVAKAKYNANNIKYECADLNLDTINGSYDGIVCFETLEHLKNPDAVLKNLYDILDSNGIMILSIPNSKYEIIENGQNKDPFHLQVFTYDGIVDKLQSLGFYINNVYGQSYINKIVNKEIEDYKITDVINDARTIAYPNKDDMDKTYSYIFILSKKN